MKTGIRNEFLVRVRCGTVLAAHKQKSDVVRSDFSSVLDVH